MSGDAGGATNLPPDEREGTFIVWNETKTEGFVTTDWQLAYEVRKGAVSNCYYQDGSGRSITATAFCNQWGAGNCTMERLST